MLGKDGCLIKMDASSSREWSMSVRNVLYAAAVCKGKTCRLCQSPTAFLLETSMSREPKNIVHVK